MELDRLDRTVAFINDEMSGRSQPAELHALVQAVIVTEDREGAAVNVVRDGCTATAEDALNTPFLAIGTHAEIAAHLLGCRTRWGISYFSIRDVEPFAPVIEQLKNRSHTRAITASETWDMPLIGGSTSSTEVVDTVSGSCGRV